MKVSVPNIDIMATAGSAALTPWGHSSWGRRISIQIRHAQLKYLSVGLKLKLRSILSYPSNIPNLMESLDSGHATVKTENSQPGLSQGQDPSSRVLLRSTRVATHPLLFIAVDSNPFLSSAYLTASSILWKGTSSGSEPDLGRGWQNVLL